MMCKVLIFSCISAVMLMTAAYGAPLSTEKGHLLRALIRDLELLEKSKDKIHLDLYTPNEKQECSWRSLQCYLTEMSTLENEIEDEDVDNLRNIKKNLQSLMEHNNYLHKQWLQKLCCKLMTVKNPTTNVVPLDILHKQIPWDLIPVGTGCKICEANDKKEFPAFHQELSNLLKSMLK